MGLMGITLKQRVSRLMHINFLASVTLILLVLLFGAGIVID